MTIQAVGFFCQDIRAERENAISIIGILPETANLAEFVPGRTAIARLALYVRVHFNLTDALGLASLRLQYPGIANEIPLGDIDQSIINTSLEGARRMNSPFASFFMRVDMSPFAVPALGWLKAILSVDGQDTVVASLRFATGEADNPGLEISRVVTGPIVSGQPVSQSPSAEPPTT